MHYYYLIDKKYEQKILNKLKIKINNRNIILPREFQIFINNLSIKEHYVFNKYFVLYKNVYILKKIKLEESI